MPEGSLLLTQVYVRLDGTDAPQDFMRDLLEVSVESSLHLPDVATLTVHDIHLHWTDERTIALGKTLQISARADRASAPLFDGEIVELEPDFTKSAPHLVIRAFDRLHRLSRGRHVRSFVNVSDGDLVRKVAQELGLETKVGSTAQMHPYVLQANESNLQFLQRRAAALGYLLFVQGRTLHCEPVRADGRPVELEWGRTLHEFHPRMTTVDQVNGVTVRGWDPATRSQIVGQAQNGNGAPQIGENRSGGKISQDAFGLDARALVTDRPVRSQAVADQLAQAVADRTATQFIQAEGACSGDPAIVAGAAVKVKSLGTRFSGTYFVTSATHHYNARGGYTTEFHISGQHPSTLLSTLQPDAPSSAPSGLVIGIVTDNRDPQGQGRVKVMLPWLSGEHASDWARVVAAGAGANRGIEFLPEVNDEVLVGFELGDINYPYVLGGLWNGKDPPPKSSSDVVSGGNVQQRIIRSRTGHVITLDDSDGGGGITIQDKNGNKVALDTGSNKLTIEVKGDAELKAQGNLTLQAQGQVQIKGMGVSVDGGAGTTDIKGSMVNLN